MFAGLETLSGVGPKLKPLLERLVGGDTLWDLLLHLPERWVDRRVREGFDQIVFGEVATVSGEVRWAVASGAIPDWRNAYRLWPRRRF